MPTDDGGADGGAEPATATAVAEERPWRVLVPLDVLEGESVPEGLTALCGSLPVTVMGYYVVPEQTEPDQARNQFEDRADDALDDIVALFGQGGGDVERRMVFTRDLHQSLDRVAREAGCDVILLPNPTARVERVLVALTEDVNTARITDFVAGLVAGDDVEVTVWRAAGEDEDRPREEGVVDRARSRLIDAGVAGDDIDDRVTVTDESVDAIVAAAEDHDAIVMGESEPSLASFVLGELHDRVADRTLTPVFVVKGPGDAPSDAGPGAEDDA